MYEPLESYRQYREYQDQRDAEYAENQQAIGEAVTTERYAALSEAYHSPVATKTTLRAQVGKFRNDVYKSLVAEAVSIVASCAVKAVKDSDAFDYSRESAILGQLAKSWVEEQSMYDVQSKMNSTVILSSFDCACKKYTDIIVEKATQKIDKGSEDKNYIFEIEDDDRENFYKELDAVNADELVYTIRNRVSDASQSFLNDYVKDKLEIKSIMQDTKNTVDALKSTLPGATPTNDAMDDGIPSASEYDPYTFHNPEEETPAVETPTTESVEESYMNIAKRKIHKIMNKPCMSVYEAMVLNLSTAAYKNKALTEEFVTENAKLDTDAVRTRAGVMYTWLETLNTSGLENVTEEYLKNTLEEIKNL